MIYEIEDKDCSEAAKEFALCVSAIYQDNESPGILQFKEEMKILFNDHDMFKPKNKSAKILYLFK
jgi:hypothetical protein